MNKIKSIISVLLLVGLLGCGSIPEDISNTKQAVNHSWALGTIGTIDATTTSPILSSFLHIHTPSVQFGPVSSWAGVNGGFTITSVNGKNSLILRFNEVINDPVWGTYWYASAATNTADINGVTHSAAGLAAVTAWPQQDIYFSWSGGQVVIWVLDVNGTMTVQGRANITFPYGQAITRAMSPVVTFGIGDSCLTDLPEYDDGDDTGHLYWTSSYGITYTANINAPFSGVLSEPKCGLLVNNYSTSSILQWNP